MEICFYRTRKLKPIIIDILAVLIILIAIGISYLQINTIYKIVGYILCILLDTSVINLYGKGYKKRITSDEYHANKRKQSKVVDEEPVYIKLKKRREANIQKDDIVNSN